jgi:hypothetical protein
VSGHRHAQCGAAAACGARQLRVQHCRQPVEATAWRTPARAALQDCAASLLPRSVARAPCHALRGTRSVARRPNATTGGWKPPPTWKPPGGWTRPPGKPGLPLPKPGERPSVPGACARVVRRRAVGSGCPRARTQARVRLVLCCRGWPASRRSRVCARVCAPLPVCRRRCVWPAQGGQQAHDPAR